MLINRSIRAGLTLLMLELLAILLLAVECSQGSRGY